MNINSPVKKLLVSIKQCLSLFLFTICNLIYNFLEKVNKKANMYDIKSWRLRSQKVVIGIDIDDIGN